MQPEPQVIVAKPKPAAKKPATENTVLRPPAQVTSAQANNQPVRMN